MRLTGRLASDTLLPLVSRGTPSRKYRTELPAMPLMERSKSEPTPPSSRTFTPAVRSITVLRLLMELTKLRMSTALTESAPSRSFCVLDFPITVTLSSVTVSRRLRCPCATASDAAPRAVASIKRARILLFIIITAIAPLQAVNGFTIIGIAIYAHPVLFPKQVGQKTQPGQVS